MVEAANGEFEGKREELEEITASGGCSPSLSPELNSIYQSLEFNNKRIFVKVFRFLWDVVAPASRFTGFGGVLYSYYAVDFLRIRLNISPAELSVLAFLYSVTGKGREIINSSKVLGCVALDYMTVKGRNYVFRKLKKAGYITRSTRDTSAPFLSRSYSRQPVFIRLSSSGVRLIEDMEKDLYKVLVNNCLDDLKGTKKKPRNMRPRADK
jgi:DNA-binding MarR family transcriptional regulator